MSRKAMRGWYFLLSFLVLSLGACEEEKVELKKGDPLPQMEFSMLTGPTESLEVPVGYPVMVIYFDPYCEHCNEFAATLSENVDSWGEMVYYWVSTEEEKSILEFLDKYPLLKTGYHYFLRDEKHQFDQLFGYSEVPSIFVFDEAHELVKQY